MSGRKRLDPTAYRRLGVPQGQSGRMWKISPPPTGIRSSDRPARNESIYRLSYLGPQTNSSSSQISERAPPPKPSIINEKLTWYLLCEDKVTEFKLKT